MNKYSILLLAVCSAMASAAKCGPLQKLWVKKGWSEIYEHGDRERLATLMWREIFDIDPSMRDLLKNVDGQNSMSAKFAAFSQRVLGGLDMCIALLDDEPTLNAELAHLKSQHADRGITPQNFGTMAAAIMYVFPDFLDSNFRSSEAWTACFTVIINGIAG